MWHVRLDSAGERAGRQIPKMSTRIKALWSCKKPVVDLSHFCCPASAVLSRAKEGCLTLYGSKKLADSPSVARLWGRVRRRRNWGKFETEEADLTGEVRKLSILVGRRRRSFPEGESGAGWGGR